MEVKSNTCPHSIVSAFWLVIKSGGHHYNANVGFSWGENALVGN